MGNVTLMEETYAMAGVGNRTVSLEYDRVHRLTAEVIVPVTSGPLQSTTYAYDAAHNRIRKQITGDKAGNAISTYNALNQLTGFSDSVTGLSATFAYDLNGNRTRRIGSDGQVTSYGYDAQNRLTDVSDLAQERKIDILGPNGLKAEATYTVDGNYRYDYDYRTRRIAQSEDGIKTDFVFLGGTSIMEFEGAGNDQAPLRAAGTAPTVEYIRGSDLGGGIGGILYSLREGQPSFTWYNHRGDVTAKTDTSGTLTYQAAYEAFGTRTAEQGETKDRQRANTREETTWGGLYENQRWRDLETGTYLTRDPAGFVDGPNLYAYVRQNPWSAFDPEGLVIGFIVDAAFAAYDTYQYASGNISGGEYSKRMALTAASVVANAASGGTAGLVVRGAALAGRAAKVGNAVVKTAKAVDKANNAIEMATAMGENGAAMVQSMEEGDIRGMAKAAAGMAIEMAGGKKGGKADQKMGAVDGSQKDVVPNPGKPLKEWLKDDTELLDEARGLYESSPEWQGIDPDTTDVFYRSKEEVDAIRAKKGESGGHHPHGLALGGPEGQELTVTDETRTVKNPKHSKATGLQRRIINRIKKKR